MPFSLLPVAHLPLSSPGLTGRSSNHHPQFTRDRRGYWIPAFAGMTGESRAAQNFSPPLSARHKRDARSARRPRPTAVSGQPYRRPARGDILDPGAALTAGAAARGCEADWTRHVPGRAVGERRTPEAGPLPCRAVVRACFTRRDSGPSCPPAPQAPHPSPHDKDGHASLMGQGWEEFNAGVGAGEKARTGFCIVP